MNIVKLVAIFLMSDAHYSLTKQLQVKPQIQKNSQLFYSLKKLNMDLHQTKNAKHEYGKIIAAYFEATFSYLCLHVFT